jgi:hypothetical protein
MSNKVTLPKSRQVLMASSPKIFKIKFRRTTQECQHISVRCDTNRIDTTDINKKDVIRLLKSERIQLKQIIAVKNLTDKHNPIP